MIKAIRWRWYYVAVLIAFFNVITQDLPYDLSLHPGPLSLMVMLSLDATTQLIPWLVICAVVWYPLRGMVQRMRSR